MTTRKEFIKNSLFGMFGIASADAIASVADNTTKISEEKYSQVCEYMAEKYVDKNVMGPYNDRN